LQEGWGELQEEWGELQEEWGQIARRMGSNCKKNGVKIGKKIFFSCFWQELICIFAFKDHQKRDIE